MNYHTNPYPAHPMQSIYQTNPHDTPSAKNPITPGYALQQLVRIKAATACQIINRRAVEAIQRENEKKSKGNASSKDQKEGDDHLSFFTSHSKTDPVAIPQLEISSAPKSTANITNLSLDDMKVNPDLFELYSMFYPYASPSEVSASPTRRKHPRRKQAVSFAGSSSSLSTNNSPGKRKTRKNRNITITQYNPLQEVVDQASSTTASTRSTSSTSKKLATFHTPNDPIITEEAATTVESYNHYRLEAGAVTATVTAGPGTDELRFIAPAHANVQSVISPNGGIYHPCHGYSTRKISIFDLFPGIVKYQSKKYNESDRVDYLVSFSDKSFVGVNNRKLKVDESEMWYTALKYLFNDITLGQFDYMTEEMRYIIKQYMSTHKNRMTFLKSIKEHSFLRVISDVAKKLPTDRIKEIMKMEKERHEKELKKEREKEWKYLQNLVMQRSLEKGSNHQKHHRPIYQSMPHHPHHAHPQHPHGHHPVYYPHSHAAPPSTGGYAGYPPSPSPSGPSGPSGPFGPPPPMYAHHVSHHPNYQCTHMPSAYHVPMHAQYPPNYYAQYPPTPNTQYYSPTPQFAHIVDEDPHNGVPVIPDDENSKTKEDKNIWTLVDEIVGSTVESELKEQSTIAGDGVANKISKTSVNANSEESSDTNDLNGENSNEMDVYKMMYNMQSHTEDNEEIQENQDIKENMENLDSNGSSEKKDIAPNLSFADVSDVAKSAPEDSSTFIATVKKIM